MVYHSEPGEGKFVETVTVDHDERNSFSITDAEVEELAKQAIIIDKHYQRPMDIEWAKDGDDGKIYIVQARPETVKSRASANVMERYPLKATGKVLVEGRSIGHKIGIVPAKIMTSNN